MVWTISISLFDTEVSAKWVLVPAQVRPMMTSSNGNIFPRYRPFVRGIPRTKASDAELWCFLWARYDMKMVIKHRENILCTPPRFSWKKPIAVKWENMHIWVVYIHSQLTMWQTLGSVALWSLALKHTPLKLNKDLPDLSRHVSMQLNHPIYCQWTQTL